MNSLTEVTPIMKRTISIISVVIDVYTVLDIVLVIDELTSSVMLVFELAVFNCSLILSKIIIVPLIE